MTIGTVEIHSQATSVVMSNEEAPDDITTFGDAEDGGGRLYFLSLAAVQSTTVNSFWRMLWANGGEEAAVVYRPHGNAVATPDEPHFLGTVKIGPAPDLGGEAGTQVTFTFETRLDFLERPILDDGTSGVPYVSAVSPAGPYEGDDVVNVQGARFNEVTEVTLAGVGVPFFVISDGVLAVSLDGAAPGTKNLVVTNAEGSSTATPLVISA